MKPAKACQQCRTSKRKCMIVNLTTHTSCTSCVQRNLQCSLSNKPSKSSNPPRLAASTGYVPATQIHARTRSFPYPIEVLSKFVNLYMRFIHDRPQSLFHEKTLWNDIRTKKISECLLLAICATGCRFSADSDHRKLATSLRQQSSALFAQQLETISLSNVHTCILLANIYAAEQDNALEALYFGIANRMAHVLRLHETCSEDLPLLREIKCRTWWTLYVADRWCPPGLDLPQEIGRSGSALDYPMDEIIFQEMDRTTQTYVQPDQSSVGMWKFMVTLVDMLGPIQTLNKSLVRNPYHQREVDQQVAELDERLQLWSRTLPTRMTLSDHNLETYRKSGHGGTFVALHLGYHHYCTLLFFQYLDPSSEITAQTSNYAERCRHHALTLSRLLHTARQKGDCQVVYLTVAYMTMVSSSVLLHTLLFGTDESEVQTARTQLTYNFEALVELRGYWPHMDQITRRLLTFQNACLRSTNAKTHKLDRWMVRFLLEHALPLWEKGAKNGESGEDGLNDFPSPLTPNHEVPSARTDMVTEAFADLCR